MTKSTALWVMLGGAAASAYDLFTTKEGAAAGELYGPGKAFEKMRVSVYKTTAGKEYFVSVSDAAAVVGAYFYFA